MMEDAYEQAQHDQSQVLATKETFGEPEAHGKAAGAKRSDDLGLTQKKRTLACAVRLSAEWDFEKPQSTTIRACLLWSLYLCRSCSDSAVILERCIDLST